MSVRPPVVVLFGALFVLGTLPKVEGSYEEEALQAHNNYRRIHDAPPMRLDFGMNQQAAAYAQHLARMGSLQHSSSSQRPGQGENIAMACGSGGLSAQRAVDMWYKEVCQYNFNNPGFGYGTGHFTQVVWRKSVKLGMGSATSGRCTYVVSRYGPAGNMMSDFSNNVAKGSFDKSS